MAEGINDEIIKNNIEVWVANRIWEEAELKRFLEHYISRDLKEMAKREFGIYVRLYDYGCEVLDEYIVPSKYYIGVVEELGPLVSVTKYCGSYLIEINMFDENNKVHYNAVVKIKALISEFGRKDNPAKLVIPLNINSINITSYPHPE
jgi:hypothetical protein